MVLKKLAEANPAWIWTLETFVPLFQARMTKMLHHSLLGLRGHPLSFLLFKSVVWIFRRSCKFISFELWVYLVGGYIFGDLVDTVFWYVGLDCILLIGEDNWGRMMLETCLFCWYIWRYGFILLVVCIRFFCGWLVLGFGDLDCILVHLMYWMVALVMDWCIYKQYISKFFLLVLHLVIRLVLGFSYI